MTFTVTYRGADGAPKAEAVEAASRAECLAQMKARGMAVLGVKEGSHISRVKRRGRKDDGGKNGRVERVEGKGRVVAYVLSFAFVALAIGGLWWWLGRDKARPSPEPDIPKKAALTKEVKPAAAPKPEPVATNAVPLTKEEKRAAQLKQIRDKYGDNIPENLKPVVYFLEHPSQKTFHPARTKASIFKRRSEREIASMIMTEPGTWFMRKPMFNDRFDSDFRASLDEKIEITDEDTDEQKILKQAVIDTKAELAARMKAGENPSAAMNAFADSMYELGQYRRMLQDELGKIKRDASYSDKDVQEFVETANKMLKDKGAQPIPMPKMVFRQVSLKRAAAKAAEKARKEKESAK